MRTNTHCRVLVCGILFSSAILAAQAAVYQEVDGRVVVEAENFHERTVEEGTDNHWHISPDEDGTDFLSDFADFYQNDPRGGFFDGKFIQNLPNSGNNKASAAGVGTDAYADYKVKINTPGTYQMWFRWAALAGTDDSIYGQVRELSDGPGGTVPDWHRFNRNNAEFGWQASTAGFEETSASGGPPSTWEIVTPGVYTIRLSRREDGAAVDALAFQLLSLPAPEEPGPPESPIAASYVLINEQPESLTVRGDSTANLSVTAESGGGAIQYQWQRKGPSDADFSDISGATSASLTTANLTGADDGVQYRVLVTSGEDSVTSRVVTVTVDTEGPVVESAGTLAGNVVGVCFDEAVDETTAEQTSNYSLSAGSISSATLLPSGTSVRLDVSGVSAGATLTVNNVTDLVGNAVAADSSVTVESPGSEWTAADIGDPGIDPLEEGQTIACGEDEFDIIAGGSDMWGNADHIHFLYRQESGDFDYQVNVQSLVMRDASTKAGFAVRESLEPGSRSVHAIVMPPDARNIYEAGTRAETGGDTAGWGVAGGANGNLPANWPNSWLRIKRAGNVMAAYVSEDGQDWTKFAQTIPDPAYPNNVYVGLAVTSHNNNPEQTTIAHLADLAEIPDETVPQIVSIRQLTPSTLSVSFDDFLDRATAEAMANYAFDNGLNISSVSLSEDLQTVTLRTSAPLTAGTVYTLTLNGVQDRAGNTASGVTGTVRGFELKQGVAKLEIFNGISGTPVANLTGSAKFQNNEPDEVLEITSLDIGNGRGDNYGTRTSGYVTPAQSGQYEFFVRSDDASQLFLSTDDNPANLRLIAFENDCCDAFEEPPAEATSDLIQLQAGQRYYFEYLQKEGGGGDFGQVAWREFNDFTFAADLQPISGDFLSALIDPNQPPTVTITSPASGAEVSPGANVTITAEATDPDGTVAKVEFFEGGNKIGEATSAPYTVTWNNVSGGRFALTAVATDNFGATATSDRVNLKVGRLPDLILLVVGSTPPNASDLAIIAHLESKGYELRVVEDTASQTGDADGAVLVITSSTSNSGDVSTDYTDVGIPVINWEQALQDDLQETPDDGADRGTTGGQTEVNIVDASHPMAAGLSAGLHTVVTDAAGSTFSWGRPQGDVQIVATLATDPLNEQAIIYGYEKGAGMLAGFTAPERRVHLFLENDTFAVLNEDGMALFDAAVLWALGLSEFPPPPGTEPELSIARDGANVTISWTESGTLQTADSVTGPWTDAADQSNPQTVPTSGSAQYFRVVQ